MRATDLAGVPLSYKSNPETGVVSLSGRLVRPGLLLYSASESPTGRTCVVYRSAAVVSDPAYLQSVKGSLISADHSFRSVDRGGSGVVTSAAYIDGYVAIDIMLTDPRVIAEVRSGVRQLSAGYSYDFEPMNASAIDGAKVEWRGDWNAIEQRLKKANVGSVDWIRAKNLVNNHAALVPMGRAGAACAIDEDIMDGQMTGQTDFSQGEQLPVAGETATGATENEGKPVDVASAASELMLQLLDMVESLKSALEGAGVAFDTKGFAADRAGYMGSILENLGIKATDADLSHSIALTEAYCLGYARAADAELESAKSLAIVPAVASVPTVTAVAKDESSDRKSEGQVVITSKTRSAWDKLTGKITTKKEVA